MGLNSSTKANRTFVSIVQGQFAQRVSEDTPGAIKRIIKNQRDNSEKTVYELMYRDACGTIESIVINETGDYGDQLEINMEDIGSKFTISLAMSGREAKSFLCCLKNINLSIPVTLAPYNFIAKDNGKQIIGMGVYQGGTGSDARDKEHKVMPHFSKDTPNGLPQVPEGADKDEFKLVMKSQEIFLKKWAKGFCANAFGATIRATPESEPMPKSKTTAKEKKEKAAPSDDLPF